MADAAPQFEFQSPTRLGPRFPRQRLIAALCSAFVPGSGQLLLGKRTSAVFFLTAFAVVLGLYWPLRLPQYYWGMVCLIWWSAILVVAASFHALFSSSARFTRASCWWIIIALPASLLIVVAFTNLAMIADGFHLYLIPSTAMQDTIRLGDRIIADLRYYRARDPMPGDVILFRKDGNVVIKRVIGTPGTIIEAKNGVVSIDGNELAEPYAVNRLTTIDHLNNFGPTKLPPSKFFVIGDNRAVSYDSRMPKFGLIDRSAIIGKAMYIVGPNNRLQIQ